MKMENQEKVWNAIASDWHKLKTIPSKTVTEFLNKSRGKILDFGSGSGRDLLWLKPKKDRELYLVDFSSNMLKLAKQRAKTLGIKIKTEKSNIVKTDFKDSFFDGAVFDSVLHCIPEEEKRKETVRELFRILKSKAEAVILVWNKKAERFKNSPKEKFVAWKDKGKRYYYLYDEKEIYDLFEKCGFKIIIKNPDKDSIIFVVQKP